MILSAQVQLVPSLDKHFLWLTPWLRTLLFKGSHGHRIKSKPQSLEVRTLPRPDSPHTPMPYPAREPLLWAWGASPGVWGLLLHICHSPFSGCPPSSSWPLEISSLSRPTSDTNSYHLSNNVFQLPPHFIHSQVLAMAPCPRMWPPEATSPILGPLTSSPWSRLHGCFWSPGRDACSWALCPQAPAWLPLWKHLLMVKLWSNSALLGGTNQNAVSRLHSKTRV